MLLGPVFGTIFVPKIVQFTERCRLTNTFLMRYIVIQEKGRCKLFDMLVDVLAKDTFEPVDAVFAFGMLHALRLEDDHEDPAPQRRLAGTLRRIVTRRLSVELARDPRLQAYLPGLGNTRVGTV